MLKYVFGLIFVALAWGAVLVFDQLPTWPAVLVSIVVPSLFVLVAVVRAMAARRAAGALESEIANESKRHGASVRPELQGQVEAMRLEFDKALRTLKSSRSGARGRNALAVLPWYLIIGPPGTGKSTVLRNSGLRFPFLSAKKGAVKGVGGTRNCDWWLSNDAIFLDTAGRWTTEDEDTEEWLAFLDILKKSRKGKAVNGVLVAVGAEQLLSGTEETIVELAARLRERLDELGTRLEIVVPVYFLVTKCDLIAGFQEMFGVLDEAARGQVWGFTLPVTMPGEEKDEVLVEKLHELLEIVEARSLERLAEERRLEERHRTFQFPQEFEELCPNLIALLRELFAENAYTDTPVLRGVYFTSGTQEGRPVDKIMNRMAKAFDLSPRAYVAERAKAKAYFLQRVFKDVLFPDQDLVGLSSREIRRQRLIGWGVAGASILLAVTIAITPALAYRRNRLLADEARKLIGGLSEGRASTGDLGAGRGLEALAPQVDHFWMLTTEGPPVGMTFGFYQGDKLAEPLAAAIRANIVVPTARHDLDFLRQVSPGRQVSLDDARDRLARYLLLSRPRVADEPSPDTADWSKKVAPALREGLLEGWKRSRLLDGQAVSELSARTYRRLVDLYLLAAQQHPALWLERDVETVERARASIRTMTEQDPLAVMIGAPELSDSDLSLGRILGEGFTLFHEDAKVGGAFTRKGFELVDKRMKAIEDGTPSSGTDDATWVLGPREPLTKERIDAIRSRYFETYEKQWRGLLATVYPREPRDLVDAESILRRHQEGRPLVQLFKALAENLQFGSNLEIAASEAAGGTLDKILGKLGGRLGDKKGTVGSAVAGAQTKTPGAVLRARFAPLIEFGSASAKEGAPPPPIDAYYQEVGKLQQALLAYDDSRDVKALRKEMALSKQRALEMAEHYGREGWAPILTKMLMPLFSGVESVVVGTGDESANRAWCDAVVLPFDELLKDRYPFRSEGKDAALADVEKFFQPKQGTLWAHYQDALKQDVESVGKRFRLRERATVQYRVGLITFLGRALALTDVLFPGGGEKIAPSMDVRLHSASGASGTASRVTFRVGPGKPLEYGNWTERWERISWPAPGARLVVLGDIRGLPRELTAEGDWGLFHLLDRGARYRGRDHDEYVSAEWTLTNPSLVVRMDVKPAEFLDSLHSFEVPRTIAPGRSLCER